MSLPHVESNRSPAKEGRESDSDFSFPSFFLADSWKWKNNNQTEDDVGITPCCYSSFIDVCVHMQEGEWMWVEEGIDLEDF